MAGQSFTTAFRQPAVVGVIHLMRDGETKSFCGQDTGHAHWQHYSGRTRAQLARIQARANVCRPCARRLESMPEENQTAGRS